MSLFCRRFRLTFPAIADLPETEPGEALHRMPRDGGRHAEVAPICRSCIGPMHDGSPPDAKVAFFGALFAARTDVYAARFDNPRTGKHGWLPAVRGGGLKGVRHENRDYLPLMANVLTAHLGGEAHIGLYPLLDGDRCWWLAADFDGPDALPDALMHVKAARALQVPVAVEVSRPVGAGNCVTLCDLGVFADQAAEPVPALNAHTGHFRTWMRTTGGRVLLQCPVTVSVVVIGPAPPDQVGVPAQQGTRGDDEAQLAEVPAGQQPGQRGQDRPVCPGQPRHPDLVLEPDDLVAQDQDLGVLGAVGPGKQGEPAEPAELPPGRRIVVTRVLTDAEVDLPGPAGDTWSAAVTGLSAPAPFHRGQALTVATIPTRLARQQIAAIRGTARASLQTQAHGLWCAAWARIRLGSVRASFWASPPAILAICRFPDAPISPAPHPDALGSPVWR